MKRLLIFVLSIITVFSFSGCAGYKDCKPEGTAAPFTDRDKYLFAAGKIRTAENALKLGALIDNSFAMQVILDADGSMSAGGKVFLFNADAKAQLYIDFSESAKSRAFFESSVLYPYPDSETVYSGAYLINNYLYTDFGNSKTKKPADINFSKPGGIMDYLKGLLGLVFQKDIGFKSITAGGLYTLFTGSGIDPYAEGIINSLSKAAAMLDIKPWEIFDFTVSENKIVISLKYNIVRTLAEDMANSFIKDANAAREITPCIPSMLKLDIAIDFDNLFINRITVDFDADFKLPSKVFNKEEADTSLTGVSAVFDASAVFEKDRSKIVFKFPDDLGSYT